MFTIQGHTLFHAFRGKIGQGFQMRFKLMRRGGSFKWSFGAMGAGARKNRSSWGLWPSFFFSRLGGERTGGQRGFSLVEILVVLAVLGLLVALSLPVIGQMREKSSRAACASNLRQCGVALVAYASENNGQFPNPPGRSYPDSYGNTFVDMCKPYFSDFRIWGCPAMKAVSIDDPGNTTLFRSTYQYFAGSFPSLIPPNGVINSGRQAILGPRTLLMQDTIYTFGSAWRCNHSLGGARTTSTPSNPSFTLYHNGIPKGMNVLYGDGSVKWASYDAGMSELQWIYQAGSYKAPTAKDVKAP
jgi:prepilin-type N-terminal cleavage/methylation domain-containing protein/prepilin-type processing-associated H-X9-DG protein